MSSNIRDEQNNSTERELAGIGLAFKICQLINAVPKTENMISLYRLLFLVSLFLELLVQGFSERYGYANTGRKTIASRKRLMKGKEDYIQNSGTKSDGGSDDAPSTSKMGNDDPGENSSKSTGSDDKGTSIRKSKGGNDDDHKPDENSAPPQDDTQNNFPDPKPPEKKSGGQDPGTQNADQQGSASSGEAVSIPKQGEIHNRAASTDTSTAPAMKHYAQEPAVQQDSKIKSNETPQLISDSTSMLKASQESATVKTFSRNPSFVNPSRSAKPFSAPSSAPTLMLQVSPRIENVLMEFDNCLVLSNSSLHVWQDVTMRFVKTAMLINLKANYVEFSALDVNIFYGRQIIPGSSKENYSSVIALPGQERSLQLDEPSPLDILFDVVVLLRSHDHALNFTSYFIDTLNTKQKLVAYLKELSSFGDEAFGAINSVTVEIGGNNIARPDPLILRAQPANESYIIIELVGGAAAGACLLLVAATFTYFTCKMKTISSRPTKISSNAGVSNESIEVENNACQKVVENEDTNELYIEIDASSDDISTLGDVLTETSAIFEESTVRLSVIESATIFKEHMSGKDLPSSLEEKSSTSTAPVERFYISADSVPSVEGSLEPMFNPSLLRDFNADC